MANLISRLGETSKFQKEKKAFNLMMKWNTQNHLVGEKLPKAKQKRIKKKLPNVAKDWFFFFIEESKVGCSFKYSNEIEKRSTTILNGPKVFIINYYISDSYLNYNSLMQINLSFGHFKA